MKFRFLLVGFLVLFFSVGSWAKDIKGFMTVNPISIKLIKNNWGDFGDDSAELRVLMFSESDSGKKSHHLFPADTEDPLSASLNQSIQLDEYDGISIPLRDDTARVYILAIDDDEKGFKQNLAESGVISFIGDKINKKAAKFLYKAKNTNLVSWLISESAEQGAYSVKAFLEKNQILGTAIIEINANKKLEGEGTVTSEENSFKVFYKTTFRKNTDSSSSSSTSTQSSENKKPLSSWNGYVHGLKKAMIRAKKEQKPLMVLVTDNKSVDSKKMESKTLGDSLVKNNMQGFLFTKIKKTNKEVNTYLPSIEYTPTIFFISPKFKIINTVNGYVSPTDFNILVDDTKDKLNF